MHGNGWGKWRHLRQRYNNKLWGWMIKRSTKHRKGIGMDEKRDQATVNGDENMDKQKAKTTAVII